MSPIYELPLALDTSSLSLLLLAAALVLIWFSLMRTQRRSGRAKAPGDQDDIITLQRPSSRSSSEYGHHQLPIGEWEVRLHELSREIEGRITSKLGLLENLVREADRAAARLEAALRAASHVQENQAASLVQGEPLAFGQPLGTQRSAESQQTLRAGDTHGESSAFPAESATAQGKDPSPPSHSREERRCEEVYMLADYGYPVEEIAYRTGLPVGEVQLILSLRKTQKAADRPAPGE